MERWIEGNSLARQRLDQMPWTLEKTLRRGLKHAVLAGFALVLAHVFLSYFISLPRLYAMMRQAPAEHWGAFSFVFLTAAALWFDFAWFREQFCIVLCPYGRLQSVLVDPDTLVIGYDAKRGEPRGPKSQPDTGDCVDCNRCVQVCPTGIDIRQGLQMECIGCAACVDACNTVMSKLDRPQGLIRYDSMNGLVGKPTRWIRPRILLYTALLCLGAAALSAGVSTLHLANMSVVRMSGAPYFLEQGNVRNQFLLRLINKRNAPLSFDIEMLGGPANLRVSGAQPPVTVPALSEQIRPLVIALPRTDFTREFPLQVRVRSADGKTTLQKELTFIGPAGAGHPTLP
jgi:cytochrome c oxidase accessory protein FixG